MSRTAWSPKIASRTRWARIAVPPAMPISAPTSPPVLPKATSMRNSPIALTPYAAMRALVRRPAPSDRTSSRTSPCHSRTSRSTSGPRFADGLVRSGWSRRTGRATGEPPPGAHRLGGRRLGVRDDEGGDARVQRLPQRPRGRRRPLDRGGEAVAPLGDGRLDLAEELPGADELLPPGEDLAAQQGAVGHPVADPTAGLGEGVVGGLAQGGGGVLLVTAGHDELGGAAGRATRWRRAGSG